MKLSRQPFFEAPKRYFQIDLVWLFYGVLNVKLAVQIYDFFGKEIHVV